MSTETSAPAAPSPATAPAAASPAPAAGASAPTEIVAPKPYVAPKGNRAASAARVVALREAESAQAEAPSPAVPAEPERPAAEQPKAKPSETKEEPAEEDAAATKAKLDRAFKEARRQQKQARAWRDEQARHAAEVAADKQLRERDPYAWIEKHGLNFRDVAHKAVAKETETPEQKAARERDTEFQRIKAELDELKAERAAVKQQESLAVLRREASSEYTDTSGDFPTLSAYYESAEVAEAVTQVRLEQYQKTGRDVPIRRVLQHLEETAKKEHQRFSKAAQVATERGERATPGGKTAETRATVRPVTNKDSATRASSGSAEVSASDRRANSLRIAAKAMGRG